jgi:hypothetical protein
MLRDEAIAEGYFADAAVVPVNAVISLNNKMVYNNIADMIEACLEDKK